MNLVHGDCLAELPKIPDGSIDMVLTDPPYGTTACAWDSVIPLEPMWKELKRVIKPNGAIALFGCQPFTSVLITSNLKMYRHNWLWNKVVTGSPFNRLVRPLPIFEEISVFGTQKVNYYPIMQMRKPENIRPLSKKIYPTAFYKGIENSNQDEGHHESGKKYPTNEIIINRMENELNTLAKKEHPSQKPVKLMEYLILTYTNAGETVLDFTCGSGTTGVACCETGRDFIGIELDEGYFKIAQERIKKAQAQPRLF